MTMSMVDAGEEKMKLFFPLARCIRSIACFVLILLPRQAAACACQTSFSPCNEVGNSNLVFIGKVESIGPVFLSRWNLSSRPSLASMNAAYLKAQEHPGEAALSLLRDAYLKAFPDLPAAERNTLAATKTLADIEALFNVAVDRGIRVRFSVKTLFKHEDDDDDDLPKKAGAKENARKAPDDNDKDDKKSAQSKPGKTAKPDDDDQDESDEFFEVSTPFGDCGYDFQLGEAYLVYANNEEGSGNYFTGSCTRTRRLSEAGEDLAFLFFYKDDPNKSTRLEGFTTTDASNPLDFDSLHDPVTVKSPVSGIVVSLQSGHSTRYAQSDRNGRFLFDGLGEGDYQVSAFANGYPAHAELLAGPQQFHAEQKSCARQFLLLPGTENRLK